MTPADIEERPCPGSGCGANRLRVVAVVPAFNEQERVGDTVHALLSSACADAVVVVDDGSFDGTTSRAAQAGAWVVRLPRNLGKGGAVMAGLKVVRDLEPEVVVFADADLGDTAHEMYRLTSLVLHGGADMAVAGFPASRGAAGFGTVVRLARAGVARLAGIRLEWPLSGQRAMKTGLILGMAGLAPVPVARRPAPKTRGPAPETARHPTKSGASSQPGLEPGFGLEVGLAIDWLRAGYTIVEVPTQMHHRDTGRNLAGFAHRARQCWAVTRALAIRAVMRQAPVLGSLEPRG